MSDESPAPPEDGQVFWVWVCLGFSDEMFEGFVEVFTDEAKARAFAAEDSNEDEGIEWQVQRAPLIY